MRRGASSSSPGIKPNRYPTVKALLQLLALSVAAQYAAPARAVEPTLPDIEAKTYDASLVRKSRSKRVWLFRAGESGIPGEGRILLLKRGESPVTAVRVLKIYGERNEFAAKSVRWYGENKSVDDGSSFVAVEKIQDVIPPPPTPQDKADLSELEKPLGTPEPVPLASQSPLAVPSPVAVPSPLPTPALPSPSPLPVPSPIQAQPTPQASALPSPQPSPLPLPPVRTEPSPLPESAPPVFEKTPSALPPPPPPKAEGNDPELDSLLGQMDKGPEPEPAPSDAVPELTSQTQELPADQESAPDKAPATEQEEPPAPQFEEAEQEDEGEETLLGAAVEELQLLDPHKQWMTLGFGALQNSGSYFAGGGLRYGFTFKRLLWLRRNTIQDTLAAEFGFYYYKILNLVTENDSYTVVPTVATLRYNMQFYENFAIFLYGGLVKNFASATSELPSKDTADFNAGELSKFFPAIGAGLLFRVGPNWDARVDVGTDIVGLGLMLRF